MKKIITLVFVLLCISTANAQNCITLTQGSFSVKESFTPTAAFDSLELQVTGCTPGTYEIAYNGVVDPAYNVTVVAPTTSFTKKVKVLPPPAINQFQVKKVGEATCVSNFIVFLYPTVLPVKLISFNATNQGNGKVAITWKVDLDTDAERYEIERSVDGRVFTTGALIFPRNASGTVQYTYADQPPVAMDVVHYRLKMVNKNAKSEYSNSVRVTINTLQKGKGITVMPNPIVNSATLQLDGIALKPGSTVNVMNINGQYVMKTTVSNSTVDLSSLRSGTYVLEITDQQGTVSRQKIIKQ